MAILSRIFRQFITNFNLTKTLKDVIPVKRYGSKIPKNTSLNTLAITFSLPFACLYRVRQQVTHYLCGYTFQPSGRPNSSNLCNRENLGSLELGQ